MISINGKGKRIVRQLRALRCCTVSTTLWYYEISITRQELDRSIEVASLRRYYLVSSNLRLENVARRLFCITLRVSAENRRFGDRGNAVRRVLAENSAKYRTSRGHKKHLKSDTPVASDLDRRYEVTEALNGRVSRGG